MPHKFTFIVTLLSISMALVMGSTDIYIPCLPRLMQEFNISEQAAQFTISINAFGFCFSGLVIGPLVDFFGRRKILLLSLIGFSVSSYACAQIKTIEMLYAYRFMQGIFAASLPSICTAFLADSLKGRKFTQAMSLVGVMITLAFAVAPILGGLWGEKYGWRILFMGICWINVLFIIAFYFLYPETLVKNSDSHISLKPLFKKYIHMICDLTFVKLGLLSALILGGYISFLSISSYYYINVLGITPSMQGLITGLTVTSNVIGHLIVGSLVNRFGTLNVLKIGIAMISIGIGLIVLVITMNAKALLLIAMPVAFISGALGFIFPPTTAMAIQSYRSSTGTAAALLGWIRMMGITIATWLAGVLYHETLFSTMIVILGCCILAITVFLQLRHKLVEELH